ncbi:MAG: BON domain-containing protein [Fibrobacter sp.]|nr:BON domain-containing protein [Fibrobacter sp.]
MPATHEQIKEDILNNLSRDSRIDHAKIKVEVTDHTVVLSGEVKSYTAREAAETDSWSVKGVGAVENNLRVKFPVSYMQPSDTVVKANVERLVSWDPDLYLERIEVFVENGKVILEGAVGQYWKKFRVEELARGSGAVSEVVNKLVVDLTEKISDEKIGQDITFLLGRNPAVDVSKITVEIKNGNVALYGTVPGRTGYDIAENIVRYTQGVVSVKNKLTIASS